MALLHILNISLDGGKPTQGLTISGAQRLRISAADEAQTNCYNTQFKPRTVEHC